VIANPATALTMTTGSRSDCRAWSVVFISPYLTDQGSGGGLVARTNLACLREVAPQTWAFALSNSPSTASYTSIGAPQSKLGTALCNMVGLAGRLRPTGLVRSLHQILRFRPAIVFLDSSSLGWLALLSRLLVPHSHVVVFFYNIEVDFQMSRSRHEGRGYWLSAIAEYINERLCAMSAHSLLMLTPNDSHRAQELYGRGADALTPVALGDDPSAAMEAVEEQAARSNAVLFVGSNFFANREAALYLVEQLAPALAQRGDTQIWIAGNAFDATSWSGALPSNVHILGRVDDLTELYRKATAFVAPIFSGAGMKVKIAEALMHACPVIGSEFALRGYVDEVRRPHLVAASSVRDYLVAIDACRSHRQQLAVSARQDFLERFSFPAAARRLRGVLEQRIAHRH
jgi:glycosyltransferase involved in cell wall biosynthesis